MGLFIDFRGSLGKADENYDFPFSALQIQVTAPLSLIVESVQKVENQGLGTMLKGIRVLGTFGLRENLYQISSGSLLETFGR